MTDLNPSVASASSLAVATSMAQTVVAAVDKDSEEVPCMLVVAGVGTHYEYAARDDEPPHVPLVCPTTFYLRLNPRQFALEHHA